MYFPFHSVFWFGFCYYTARVGKKSRAGAKIYLPSLSLVFQFHVLGIWVFRSGSVKVTLLHPTGQDAVFPTDLFRPGIVELKFRQIAAGILTHRFTSFLCVSVCVLKGQNPQMLQQNFDADED